MEVLVLLISCSFFSGQRKNILKETNRQLVQTSEVPVAQQIYIHMYFMHCAVYMYATMSGQGYIQAHNIANFEPHHVIPYTSSFRNSLLLWYFNSRDILTDSHSHCSRCTVSLDSKAGWSRALVGSHDTWEASHFGYFLTRQIYCILGYSRVWFCFHHTQQCCFALLTRGWGRLETRPQVALGSPVLFDFTMSLAPPVDPSTIFLTDTELETCRIQCNFSKVMPRAQGQLGVLGEVS